jgi:hypothetical protein
MFADCMLHSAALDSIVLFVDFQIHVYVVGLDMICAISNLSDHLENINMNSVQPSHRHTVLPRLLHLDVGLDRGTNLRIHNVLHFVVHMEDLECLDHSSQTWRLPGHRGILSSQTWRLTTIIRSRSAVDHLFRNWADSSPG